MKTLFAAATALSLTGAAFGAQTHEEPATTTQAQHAMHAMHDQTMTFDPNVILQPPASWQEPQLILFREHMAYYPDTWTAEERAMFRAQLEVPPAQWTPDQRLLYQQHFAALPPTWTAEQRATYRQHMAHMTTPWIAHDMAAMTTDSRTYAAVPATAKIVPPSNADPELDERGIPVISAAAVIPPGFNGLPEGAMGGPLADAATGDVIGEEEAYPACTASVTDNCIQLYERGVRRSLADWNHPTGGFAGTEAGMGGPYDPADEDARWNSHATQSSPTGTAPNDPVDTQGATVIDDNPRGIDADGAE